MIKNHELDQIALWEMAKGTAAHVEGMKDFASYYLNGLTTTQRRLLNRYDARKNKLTDRFLAEAEAAGWNKLGTIQ